MTQIAISVSLLFCASEKISEALKLHKAERHLEQWVSKEAITDIFEWHIEILI